MLTNSLTGEGEQCGTIAFSIQADVFLPVDALMTQSQVTLTLLIVSKCSYFWLKAHTYT